MKELICLFCKGRFPIDEFYDKENPVCTECETELQEIENDRERKIEENSEYEDG